MRHAKLAAGVSSAVTGALLIVTAIPVAASSLLAVDVPQVVAVAGTDLHVPVSVSSACVSDRGATCGPVTISVVFAAPDGHATAAAATFPDRAVRAAVLVVPGRDIAAPAFHYWIAARQDECTADGCRTITARAPIEGSYTTVVVAGPFS